MGRDGGEGVKLNEIGMIFRLEAPHTRKCTFLHLFALFGTFLHRVSVRALGIEDKIMDGRNQNRLLPD